MLKSGIYEQVISRKLEADLAKDEAHRAELATIDEAEAAKILAKYLKGVVEKGLSALEDGPTGLASQLELVNRIVAAVAEETGDQEFGGMGVDEPARQLLALLDKVHGPRLRTSLKRPITSIAASSLFTGASHEPAMFTELKKEISSADRIDLLVSFIKWSGLRLIIEELKQFTQAGGCLRVITTTYMGATDLKALEELLALPNTEIRISYDTQRTRLHAKAYVFRRDTGYTTAYIGSSNLSNAAISSGLEWNLKITQQDLPDTLRKIDATFTSYWGSADFEPFNAAGVERFQAAIASERRPEGANQPFLFDLYPYAYQREILDKLTAEREIHGYYKNLIVAATGTGKTLISAFDYLRFVQADPQGKHRLLFVAHREEILQQSLLSYQAVLKDPNFGELFVGSHKPEGSDHLFMSIQTFNSRDWPNQTSPDFYDYIVVDEFHHAASPSYQSLMDHYTPRILLGLTATPERMDGKSILGYFDNRIAADIRLPEAIERKLLCPFQYFGVSDEVDLSTLKWSRGGYDIAELSNLYSINRHTAQKRAGHIVNAINRYVTGMEAVKGLGFCVSVAHAQFMAEFFNDRGIPAICLSAESPREERDSAKGKLVRGEIRFIFVVDLYNEGIDIPEVNTVLFLRPTESLTVFLQQLGRGLRIAEGKECLTVLDFIGQANKKYNFEDKFKALLGPTDKSLPKEIADGFASVPKGCYIHLEKKAQAHVLDNIKASINGSRRSLLERIRTFGEDSGKPLSLTAFLDYYHLSPKKLYKLGTFTQLCREAGVSKEPTDPLEGEITSRVMQKLSAMDSLVWIDWLAELFLKVESKTGLDLSGTETKLLNMFQFTLWGKTYEACGFSDPLEGIRNLAASPGIGAEIRELLHYLRSKLDIRTKPLDLGFPCPLEVYANYHRDQILLGLDYFTPGNVREGVKYFPDKKLDVFFVTLNKTDKEYSPLTMYEDYSIDEGTFHWQSQHTTSESSPTGQRYINHGATGNKLLLFVREYKTEEGAAAPYTCLGLCNYLSHEGSSPMSITFKLEDVIPAKYLKTTNQLVV